MMRAIAVAALKGKPQLMVLPKPTPRSDQLLVKVSVAGMNPFDWQLTDGVMTGVMPNVLPFVMGIDASFVETGQLVVPIEATISLEQAPEAVTASRSGHARGKTVIRM